MTMFKLTRDELLSIKRLLTLLHSARHDPGTAKDISEGRFDCDRAVELAIYTIEDVLKRGGEIPRPTRQQGIE